MWHCNFLPILLATFTAAFVGLITVALIQKINLFDRTILLSLTGIAAFIGGLIYVLSNLSKDQISTYSNFAAYLILFLIVVSFILMALRSKINVYEAFIDGAEEGFQVAIGIVPYLIGILIAIAMFRSAGAMELLTKGVS